MIGSDMTTRFRRLRALLLSCGQFFREAVARANRRGGHVQRQVTIVRAARVSDTFNDVVARGSGMKNW